VSGENFRENEYASLLLAIFKFCTTKNHFIKMEQNKIKFISKSALVRLNQSLVGKKNLLQFFAIFLKMSLV